jgi:hypothetical protein
MSPNQKNRVNQETVEAEQDLAGAGFIGISIMKNELASVS